MFLVHRYIYTYTYIQQNCIKYYFHCVIYDNMSQNTSTLAVKNMPVRRLNTDERMKRTYLNLNLQAAQEDTQIARKHDIQRMRSIRHLKKHQPDSWLLQKMKDQN